MTRFWPTVALITAPMMLLWGAPPTAASTQATITIIMTTLGTDGAPTTSSTTLPAGSSVTVSSSPGICDPTDPGPVITPTEPPSVPTGGTGNPGTETPTAPAEAPVELPTTVPPVSNPNEPSVPTPPVVLAPVDNPPNPIPIDGPVVAPVEPIDAPVETTSSSGSPAETPEPATLTLAIFGVIGAAGWAKRRKKVA